MIHDREAEHARLMDSLYHHWRHIYDDTRKFFLVGRDRMLRNIPILPGQTVVEIGCGTARNLIHLHKQHPDIHLAGLDASQAMLQTAQKNMDRAELSHVPLIHAYANQFDPNQHLPEGQNTVDHLIYSYCLSMMPNWRDSLTHGWSLLPIGGTLNIVDFGAMDIWPDWVRVPFLNFLSAFHVQPEVALHDWVYTLPQEQASISQTELGKGYAIMTRVMRVG